MIPQKPSHKILLLLVVLNIISTGLHYTDNARFLSQYPGPQWFTPLGIILTFLIMTPVGILGYWFYQKSAFRLAYLLLGFYSITSISSPGHYLFPRVAPMSFKMQSLIGLDGASGLSLIIFVLWSSLLVKEWRNPLKVN